jgi:uncharacterized protein YjbI with pentapeptide repeats
MAKAPNRRVGPLLGGLLVGALGGVALILRRGRPLGGERPRGEERPPSADPAPATKSSGQSQSTLSDTRPQAVPSATSRPPGIRISLLIASVGIAAMVVLAAVVVAPMIARAGPWRLPLAIAGVIVLLASCLFILPALLAPSRGPDDLAGVPQLSAKDRIQLVDDRRKLQNEVRTALLQAVAGGAVLVGVLFTWQQQQATSRQIADQLSVTRQGQVGERFSRAVDQLGNASIDVRLGGLYELEQLARQAPERRLVIIEVVAAFVREHARPPAKTRAQPPARELTALAQPPAQDVAAALTIIGRRSTEQGDPLVDLSRASFGRVNLARANLRRVALTDANLNGADLSGTNLVGGNLTDANLVGGNLADANLSGADLARADLDRADLHGADLRGANLRITNLRGADLEGANVARAQLVGTNMGGANLGTANLVNANLRGAFLSGASLVAADLQDANFREAVLVGSYLNGANLREASLNRAFLSGANLADADLRGADLRGAFANEDTEWPKGFDYRRAGVKRSRHWPDPRASLGVRLAA